MSKEQIKNKIKEEIIMSKENVKKFYEVLSTDKVLGEKVIAMNKKLEGLQPGNEKIKEIFEQELTPMLKEAGFEFSYEDLLEYTNQQTSAVSGKLLDEELDSVTGGGLTVTVSSYGCNKWSESSTIWWAVKGQCGSCRHWMGDVFLGTCNRI